MIQEIAWSELDLRDLATVSYLLKRGIAKDAVMNGDKKVLRVWY